MSSAALSDMAGDMPRLLEVIVELAIKPFVLKLSEESKQPIELKALAL